MIKPDLIDKSVIVFERSGCRGAMIKRQSGCCCNILPKAERIICSSPAKNAGIVSGDIIVEFDGTKLGDNDIGLADLIGKKKVGDFGCDFL